MDKLSLTMDTNSWQQRPVLVCVLFLLLCKICDVSRFETQSIKQTVSGRHSFIIEMLFTFSCNNRKTLSYSFATDTKLHVLGGYYWASGGKQFFRYPMIHFWPRHCRLVFAQLTSHRASSNIIFVILKSYLIGSSHMGPQAWTILRTLE